MSAIPNQKIKSTDSKGRITLPPQFKGQYVYLRQVSETRVEIDLAAVVPANELWLHKNPDAMAKVQSGLDDLANSRYAANPPVIPAVSE